MNNMNVLFIDDDKVTLKLVKGILEGAGYVVHTLTDPREALDILDKSASAFDLVITDANMPGGVTGFDLVKTLRGQPKYNDLPIAFLTGRREKKDIESGLQAGADDYIVKPIDPHILLGKIDALIKKKNQESPKMRFPERAVNQAAEWDIQTRIMHVSERGMTVWSPLTAPIDTKIKLKSEFFAQLGIPAPVLRVIGYTKDPQNLNMYFTNLIFIGLNDNELQKIRVWLVSQVPQAPKAS